MSLSIAVSVQWQGLKAEIGGLSSRQKKNCRDQANITFSTTVVVNRKIIKW